ncbi:hypothetical protein MMC18_007105 [Xylographa bjoerkii]|nr:hypothetical protein [Xylographa bjoerkii]
MNQHFAGGSDAPPMNAPPPQGGAQGEDYLDKALDAVEKKFGGAGFQDPNSHRALNEKITDAIRNFFEKITGYVDGATHMRWKALGADIKQEESPCQVVELGAEDTHGLVLLCWAGKAAMGLLGPS